MSVHMYEVVLELSVDMKLRIMYAWYRIVLIVQYSRM